MINYNEFIWKWNGRFVDYDHAFGNQCVDLMRRYCYDVFGVNGYIAIPPTGNAINIFNNFPNSGNKYFSKVFNGPNNIPQKGDIVFFKWYPLLYGLAGHVEIVDQADLYYMVNFAQNWPTGSPCHFQKRGSSKLLHGYRGCVGWLHPKV